MLRTYPFQKASLRRRYSVEPLNQDSAGLRWKLWLNWEEKKIGQGGWGQHILSCVPFLLSLCLLLVRNKIPHYYLPWVNETPSQEILTEHFSGTYQALAAKKLFPFATKCMWGASIGCSTGTHPTGKNCAPGFWSQGSSTVMKLVIFFSINQQHGYKVHATRCDHL